ncbi:hypothetical protein DFAR_1540015 [Desulfarculales bacterium]
MAVYLYRFLGFFRRTFKEEVEPELLNRLRQGDKIEEMVAGMEALGSHLDQARRQLVEHAAGLERRVAKRTDDLKREAVERRQDVELFVRRLDDMSQSRSRHNLLKRALPRVARRFGAAEAGYFCVFSEDSYYAWPEEAAALALPPGSRERLLYGESYFEPRRALLPVTSQDAVQGVLFLAWTEDADLAPQGREVLMALARQLGIALKNLTVLDNLLEQRDILVSIFESVSDPMAFLDE